MTDKFNNEAKILPAENEEEIWLPVPEFETRYEVSNFGNVRNKTTKKIRKLSIDHFGYPYVCLRKYDKETYGSKVYYRYVHRLVCEAFHGTPTQEYNICDHIDRCKVNNYYRNLHWTNYSENSKNHKPKNKIKYTMDKTPIVYLDLDGNLIQRFDSIKQASKLLNMSLIQIAHNIRGEREPFKNGYFMAADEFDK